MRTFLNIFKFLKISILIGYFTYNSFTSNENYAINQNIETRCPQDETWEMTNFISSITCVVTEEFMLKKLKLKNQFKICYFLKVRLRWFGAGLAKLLYLCHLSGDLYVLYIK